MTSKKEKKPHLGRGLEALLGNSMSAINNNTPQPKQDFPPDNKLKNALSDVEISKILPNPYQPRTAWNETELTELTESIRQNGVIQPILLRKTSSGYQIIAGERRYRAAQNAGLKQIPAIVRQATDEEMLELALVENIHRSDLNPIERAKAYRQYLDTFGLNQTQAAQKIGEDRSVVSNYLRLLDLPKEIKDMLIDRTLSMGHARAILSLPSDELKRKIANRALTGRLSVREVERLVRQYLSAGKQSTEQKKEKPFHIVDLETRLKQSLGTKVTINTRKGGSRGRIIIDFYSLDEFDRLSEKMGVSVDA